MYGKDFDYDHIPPERRLPIIPSDITEPNEGSKYGMSITLRSPYPNEKIGKAIILNFETTGLDRFNDDPVELGFVKVTYSKDDGKIFQITDEYQGFKQPKKEISAKITDITGITNEMVESKDFDYAKIFKLFSDVNLVISHNAAYDCPFFDRVFKDCDSLLKLPWACSMIGVDWRGYGYQSCSLVKIIAHNRFIYKAHRALNDAMALTNILYFVPQYFIDLRRSAANMFTVLAIPESVLKNNEKDRGTISRMGFFKTRDSAVLIRVITPNVKEVALETITANTNITMNDIKVITNVPADKAFRMYKIDGY